MNAKTGRTRTNNVVDTEVTLVRDPRKLGTEVRKQSHGTSTKDLVFDPETGEFVIGQKGVSGAGDIVTQMTEDGFAARASPKVCRYNDATGEFEYSKAPAPAPVPRYNEATGEFENIGVATRARKRAATPRRAPPIPRRRFSPPRPVNVPQWTPPAPTPTQTPPQHISYPSSRGHAWIFHGNIPIVVGALLWFFVKPWLGITLVAFGVLHKVYHFLERD